MNFMCQVDISNQINNSWNKHSVMALVGKGIKFAVKINSSDKRKIRKRFRKTITERDIACWIHAFLIFVCWRENKIVSRLEICPDCRPTEKVYTYLQRIASVYGYKDFSISVKISFSTIKQSSPAHALAKKAYKHNKKVTYSVTDEDINEIVEIMSNKEKL